MACFGNSPIYPKENLRLSRASLKRTGAKNGMGGMFLSMSRTHSKAHTVEDVFGRLSNNEHRHKFTLLGIRGLGAASYFFDFFKVFLATSPIVH